MTNRHRICFAALGLLLLTVPWIAFSAEEKPTTRQMNLMNWMEFRKLVPRRIDTVLVPVGSLEAHGVLPNGTDNLCPQSMAAQIVDSLGALVAPTLNYGITPSLNAYPGTVTIGPEAYRGFVTDVLRGMAKNRFLNIIVLNGHGGNTGVLKEVAKTVSNEEEVRVLVVNWWTATAEITFEVFGENGGHAGNNETAYVQAVVPDHIHPEWYRKELAMPNPPSGAYTAIPTPATIGLYARGEGYPTFDEKQSREYYRKVNEAVLKLIQEVIAGWDRSGVWEK